MPTKQRMIMEAAKKALVAKTKQASELATSPMHQKAKEEKRAPTGGIELINEHQETIFDTKLSAAADDYTKACKEHKLWGEKEKSTAKSLIEEMKRMKLTLLRVGTDKIIKYKFIESKDVITLKDYKPKKVRRRNF